MDSPFWTPVDDALPETHNGYSTDVLVVVDFTRHGGVRSRRMDRLVEIDGERGWVNNPSDYVTHWMHLPPLPPVLNGEPDDQT